jgi:Tol biopolymer transport system component
VKSGDRFPVVEADGSGHDWWPGDSGIVYTDRDRTGIWFVPVDPATRTVGTPYRILDLGLYPRVSPDGSKIAFCRGGVRVFDFDTQTESLIPQSVYAPSWSPDGSKLAFGGVVCYGPGADLDEVHCHSEIVIANPDGTEWTPVTALHSNTSFPTWSPDGSELAFFSAVSGSKALYKTTIGSGVVTLLYEGAEQASDWAP